MFDSYAIIMRERSDQGIVCKTTCVIVVNSCILVSCTPCSRSVMYAVTCKIDVRDTAMRYSLPRRWPVYMLMVVPC